VETYHPDRDEHSVDRLTIAAHLRRAIDDGDIEVHYQPMVRLFDGATTGAEALVRWHHPERGAVRPDDFISVAERTGLIRPLTTHVLRTALAQCHEWRTAGHDMTVAVNLSVRSLLDLELPDDVSRIIDESGAQPGWLTFEITESTIMDSRRGMSVLERLSELGVKLSIDDFGTGYSSLAYLQRLPVHELKVDQSFVMAMDDDPQNASIVRTVIDLAHNLGLRVVAEGVETQLGWEALSAMDCDTCQGFLLSRAIPGEVLTTWLQERSAAIRPLLITAV
jgi:EAL domain-containing protein (putative c-di-GMP-specific phosphodiesterase class I)